jgi:hypothetical protein
VEAWNDATGFFADCPSPKAQITGFGFSKDGGKTFTDLQGPPDSRCAKDPNHPQNGDIYLGSPSVVAYQAAGHTYFYIASLFDNAAGLGRSFVALAAWLDDLELPQPYALPANARRHSPSRVERLVWLHCRAGESCNALEAAPMVTMVNSEIA